MPSVNCPVPGCTYATPDTEAVIVAALLTTHATLHNSTGAAASGTAKVEKVKRPTIGLSSMSEDWTYFLTRWEEYKEATRVTGREVIVQLIECCFYCTWLTLISYFLLATFLYSQLEINLIIKK